ncbi:MAG: hypothetical protein WC231_03710 [Dehalococcoidales bacterium]
MTESSGGSIPVEMTENIGSPPWETTSDEPAIMTVAEGLHLSRNKSCAF